MSAGDGLTRVQFHVGRYGHPYFAEQLRIAPDGFAYVSEDRGASEQGGRAPRRIVLEGNRLARARQLAETAAVGGLASAGYIRRRPSPAPSGCALVHSAQLLLRSPALPYVLDFECVEVFALYQRVALRRPWARRRLLDSLSDERCRFLLPWSDAARRGIRSALGADAAQRLEHKTLTVLPAIVPRAARPARWADGPLRVLFVGTAFEAKGGVEVLRAVACAREGQDVELHVVSNVPPRWRAEAARCAGIVIHDWPVPAAGLEKLFRDSHVLVFPSHMDTLGFVMLEAMAYGLPVLATRHFAVEELVEDEESGLLVEGETLLYGDDGLSRFDRTIPLPRSFRRALTEPSDAYVDRLARALSRIAGDRELHSRLAAGAFARVTDGPLSVARRREALGAVYRQAAALEPSDSVRTR